MVLECDIHIEKNDQLLGESFFELRYNKEQIFSVNSANDFETYSIYYGILGMILSLIRDHNRTMNTPQFDLISEDEKYADSFPLFTAIGGLDDGGYEDIGIKIDESIVTISQINGKKWDVPLSEYIDVLFKCIEEILRCFKYIENKEKNEHNFEPYAWFALWLIQKVALESSNNIQSLVIPKLVKITKDWKIWLG